MKCLVVVASPLKESLCTHLANHSVQTLNRFGHDVVVEDLYSNQFDPVLSVPERKSYYSPAYDGSAIEAEAQRLLNAEGLILVFPTWWFGFPAMMKGWFDRVWGPGIAYDHASNFGPIAPRLQRLKTVLAITTLGATWWVDRLIMRQPVKKLIKFGLIGACCPKCRFNMLSLYKCEDLSPKTVQRFQERITRSLKDWK